MSDEEVKDYMVRSSSVDDWNLRREQIKMHRDSKWIAINIDASRLITKCNFDQENIVTDEELFKEEK
jgi:hypothetical protein